MTTAQEANPETVELLEVMESWGELLGFGPGNRQTMQHIVDVINETTDGKPRHPRLQAAALAVVGRQAKARAVAPREFGYWLRQYKQRFVSGLRIMSGTKGKHGVLWWIERADGKNVDGSYTQATTEPGPATNGHAPGDLVTLRLIWIDGVDTAGTAKAKGNGARLYGRDEDDKQTWLANDAIVKRWFDTSVENEPGSGRDPEFVTITRSRQAKMKWHIPDPRFAQPTAEELDHDDF